MPKKLGPADCRRRSYGPRQLRVLLEKTIPHACIIRWAEWGGRTKGGLRAFDDALWDANRAWLKAGGPSLAEHTVEVVITDMRGWYMEAMRKIKVLDGCVKVWSTPFAEWPSQAREALARDPCAPWLPLWHDHIRLKLVFVPPSEPVISSTAAGRAALATSSAAALLPPTKQIAALPAALKAPRTLIKSSPCASLVKLPALNSQGEEIGRAAASEMAASEAVAQEQDVAEEAALEEEGPEASPGAYDQLLELEADASRATQEWVLEQQRSASAATRPASGAAVAVMPAKRPRTEAEPPVRAVASSSRAPSTAAPTSEDPSLPTSVSAILNHKRLFQLSCRIPRGDGGSDKLDEFLLFLSSLEEDGVLEPTKCSYKRAKKALYRFVELAFEVSLDLGSAESDTYELIHALGQDALAAMKDLD